ncbi:methionine--tRNA ligase, partial [Achromatium sp. WMS2]
MLNHTIDPFQPLITRIDPKVIDKILDESKEDLKAQDHAKVVNDQATSVNTDPAAGGINTKTPVISTEQQSSIEPVAPPVEVSDFAKLDLRIARIISASSVDKSDKLLELTVDLGFEQRRIFAGIKTAYNPSDLVGRLTVVVANLPPRKMRFGTSEGMVLAAGPGGKDLFLLSPDSGAIPGMRIN